MSLLKKRLFFVATAALLPGLAMLAFNELSYRGEREREVHRLAQEAGQQAASEMERIIEGVDGLLTAVAAIPAVFNQDIAGCREALGAVSSSVNSIRTIFLLDAGGKIICDSSGAPEGLSMQDRSYFRDALTSTGPTIGEYTDSRLSNSPVLPISKAVRNPDGSVKGVLATGIRLGWLGDRLRERGLPPGGAVTIADRKGVILARHPQGERFVGTRIPDTFLNLVTASGAGTIEVLSQDGETRIIGYLPAGTSPRGLYVSAGLSKAEAFKAVNRASFVGLALVTLGALAAFAAAWFVGNTFIRRPLNRIISVLERWRSGAPRSRTGMKASQGEVESVGQTVDDLLDELERRQEEAEAAQRQSELLMRELSHRVKNTLTIVQAIARQTFGPHVDKNLSRTFTDRVVALAGTYDILLSSEHAGGDIEAVIATTLRPHQNLAARITLEGPSVPLGSQAALALSMVIHELATNAIKYGALSGDAGIVAVSWTTAGEDPQRLDLLWRERDGPAVVPPASEGFGSKLVRRAFPPQLAPSIELDYSPTGLICRLSFTVEAAVAQAA